MEKERINEGWVLTRDVGEPSVSGRYICLVNNGEEYIRELSWNHLKKCWMRMRIHKDGSWQEVSEVTDRIVAYKFVTASKSINSEWMVSRLDGFPKKNGLYICVVDDYYKGGESILTDCIFKNGKWYKQSLFNSTWKPTDANIVMYKFDKDEDYINSVGMMIV